MAIAVRRALTSWHKASSFLRMATTSLNSRHILHLTSTSTSFPSSNLRCLDASHSLPISPPVNSLLQSCRCFAKGRRQRDDEDDSGTMIETGNIGPSVKAAAASQMEVAIEALSRELTKLRTGRASAGMLDHIIVETSGVKMPISRMAVVSVLDTKTLSVNPYDPNTLKELEKAIISSPLGLNPKVDSQRLIASIPPLTKEHMLAVCRVVSKSSEDVKQSIRRARQKALDTIKKAVPKKKDKAKGASSFSEDDAKRLEREIDELTKKFVKSAEDMCKAKEKEITAG